MSAPDSVNNAVTTVNLSRPLVQRLLAAAQQSPETEVCGVLGARDGSATSVYPIPNRASDPRTSFLLDEERLQSVQQAISTRNETLYAVWHSHPASPPVPSADDINGCGFPELLYLIISLNTKGVLELRGWRLNGDEAIAVPLNI